MAKVFYRNPLHDYPMVVRGEGVYWLHIISPRLFISFFFINYMVGNDS
jgi:hypothetical protein